MRSGFRSLARCRDSHTRRGTREAKQASGQRTGIGGCQVTTSERQARPVQVGTPPGYRKGSLPADWLLTTDRKVIRHLYLTMWFRFFVIAGIMRARLTGPDNHITSDQVYSDCRPCSRTGSWRCRSAEYSPGLGRDMRIMGLVLASLGTVVGGVSFVTTILRMRSPGMTVFRMPISTWHILVTSLMVLITFPVLLVLEVDRELGARVFSAASGGAILSQHGFASRPAQLSRRTANPPRTGDTDV